MAAPSGGYGIFERGDRESAPIGLLPALTIPTVLLWVHSLPRGARRELALEVGAPTIMDAFTAHFVHLTTGHLVSNLVLYTLVTSTAYMLAWRCSELRTFRRGFATVILGFPPVLSGLSVALGRPALGYGFSGLNMALFGLLTVLLARFLASRFGFHVDDWGVAMYGLGIVLVALRSLPITSVTLAVAGSAVCLSIATVVGHIRRPIVIEGGFIVNTQAGDVILAVVAGLLFCAVPLVAFSPPSSVGEALGLYVHFLGYALLSTVLHLGDTLGLLS